MKPEAIVKTALAAAASFLDRERDLLVVDANERSLTHKLAEHLQAAFSDWNVDCEYNRLGNKVKRLPHPRPSTTDDTEGRTIFPDIIVHRRQMNENLLAVEVKKTTNKLPGDEGKLCGLTALDGEYAYRLGLHLVIDCGNGRLDSVTVFTEGAVNDDLTNRARAASAS